MIINFFKKNNFSAQERDKIGSYATEIWNIFPLPIFPF